MRTTSLVFVIAGAAILGLVTTYGVDAGASSFPSPTPEETFVQPPSVDLIYVKSSATSMNLDASTTTKSMVVQSAPTARASTPLCGTSMYPVQSVLVLQDGRTSLVSAIVCSKDPLSPGYSAVIDSSPSAEDDTYVKYSHTAAQPTPSPTSTQ